MGGWPLLPTGCLARSSLVWSTLKLKPLDGIGYGDGVGVGRLVEGERSGRGARLDAVGGGSLS
jgi:hypothetical protein